LHTTESSTSDAKQGIKHQKEVLHCTKICKAILTENSYVRWYYWQSCQRL